jgi:thiol-disulfide isomerase/thioredoxin
MVCLVLLGEPEQARPVPPSTDVDSEVEQKVVSYADLCSAIRALRGRVVVVDIWADFCVPCKRNFHHLVEMHRNYAKDGLVCVSVAVDQPDKHEACLKFLRQSSATFPNYLLAEKDTFWQDKWEINGPPCIFVFDRENRRAAKMDSDHVDRPLSYDNVEQLVRKLLYEK